MKDSKLRLALIIGTAALVWTIPSCNVFAVIAVILGWVNKSVSNRKSAFASGVLYAMAALAGFGFSFLLGNVREIGEAFGLIASDKLYGFADVVNVISTVFGLIYAFLSVLCFKGGRAISRESQEHFFD